MFGIKRNKKKKEEKPKPRKKEYFETNKDGHRTKWFLRDLGDWKSRIDWST